MQQIVDSDQFTPTRRSRIVDETGNSIHIDSQNVWSPHGLCACQPSRQRNSSHADLRSKDRFIPQRAPFDWKLSNFLLEVKCWHHLLCCLFRCISSKKNISNCSESVIKGHGWWRLFMIYLFTKNWLMSCCFFDFFFWWGAVNDKRIDDSGTSRWSWFG